MANTGSRHRNDPYALRAEHLRIEAAETLLMMQLLIRVIQRPAGLGWGRVRDFGCCDGREHTARIT